MIDRISVWYLLILVMVFGSASCSMASEKGVVGEYPIDWGERLIEDKTCSLVVGVYVNTGKSSDITATYPITLDGAVFSMLPIKGEAEAVKLEFEINESRLYVQLIGESIDRTHPSSSFERPAKCVDGWLEIDRSGSGYVDGTHSESNSHLFIAISENRALIIRYKYDVKSTSLGIFKERKVGSHWYMFDRIKSN